MATFPGGVVSFTTKNAGDTIQPAHVNGLQDEVVALEDGLRNGTAALNSSNSTFTNLSVGGSTMTSLTVNTGSTLGNAVASNLSVAGGSTLAGMVAFSGIISPSQLVSGDTDNWAPTGLSSAYFIRVDTDTVGSTLTGITAGRAGERKCLVNIGVVKLGIKHDAVSAASNRFLTRSGNDTSLSSATGTMEVFYDNVSNRWRQIS